MNNFSWKPVTIAGLIIVLALLSWFYLAKDPLYGSWQSNKGDGIGLFETPGAPFTIHFTEDSMTFLGETHPVQYEFDQEKQSYWVTGEGVKFRIIRLKDGNLQFNYKVGLRVYKKI